MPRVRDTANEHSPVRVTGTIFGAAAGQVVLVTLSRQCTWRGQFIPVRMDTKTMTGGRFELLLPPSVELSTVDGAPVPHYEIVGPGLQPTRFVVPAGVAEWSLTP